ncbi:hypothetical protein CPB84DRAFT_1843260 [Gymnopilus junonius]|uniref:Metallo-beta-lactamase domain-containing protein n=1 Tax=Gymnopilus junonius TaxID=109634 RepID=A0A9P5TSH1_GYMJU|nr:hypothetical protein CPB84DRAFT_1843260 [Gymnopilus junonius]
MFLPNPAPNQPYCNVSALEAGLIDLLDEMFITPAITGKVSTAPSLAFLIRHSERKDLNFSYLSTTHVDWKPVGPFPRALDYLEDGSLYIVDAPGHLPGHINVLARTSSDGGWIFLAGDSAHHWSLITGEAQIAIGHPGHLNETADANKELAEEHIRRIRELWKLPEFRSYWVTIFRGMKNTKAPTHSGQGR